MCSGSCSVAVLAKFGAGSRYPPVSLQSVAVIDLGRGPLIGVARHLGAVFNRGAGFAARLVLVFATLFAAVLAAGAAFAVARRPPPRLP